MRPCPYTDEHLLDWFRTHVYREEDGCMRWAGPFQSDGYPNFTWSGGRMMARRKFWELLKGKPLPRGWVTYSSCGNPWCMSEAHLRAGPRKVMMGQAARMGRFLSGNRRAIVAIRGARNRVKLPYDKRHEVLRMRGEGMTTNQIGALYGITGSAVRNALQRWNRLFGGMA